jgi:hypothetical protein
MFLARRHPARLVLAYTAAAWWPSLLVVPATGPIAYDRTLGGGSLPMYCRATLGRHRPVTADRWISPEVIACRDAFGIPPDERPIPGRPCQ